MTRDEVVQALRDGRSDVTHLDNDCGMVDNVDIHTSYQGDTNRTARISSSGDCLGADEQNVVSFGEPGGVAIARHCVYRSFFGRVRWVRLISSSTKMTRTGQFARMREHVREISISRASWPTRQGTSLLWMTSTLTSMGS